MWTFEIERGGKRRIRVSDDGFGMGREDALLCLDRHATSKIRRAEDLTGIASFGFRGEALPSVAAVSRLTIETRDPREEVGTRIRAVGGRFTVVEDCARRGGTTVEVESLFFNAPARAKFLKSVGAEARAVSEVIVSLALAHPEVSFNLLSDRRALLELPVVADLGERLAQLWGEEAAAGLVPFTSDSGAIRAQGLVQRPDLARPGSRRAYFFVNGRPFREPALLRAVDRSFRTTIPAGTRPWVFLTLTVDDGSVDVNVHPTKAEVRFRDRAAVEALIEEGVRRALSGEASGASLDTSISPAPVLLREHPPRERPGYDDGSQMALFLAGSGEPLAGGGPRLAPEGARPRLWQIHNTWMLAEARNGLLIIDQHSAHERVLFERLMRAFGDGGQESQRLLFPLTLRLGPAEYRQVEELSGLLRGAGFEVEGFGGDTVIVHAVPNPHPYFDASRCFREMVAELVEGSELVRSARNQHEKIAMTFACKGAIKAGQTLSELEMEELFDALFATELPFHDVHGRPTIVRLSSGELERKFGR